MKGEAEEVVEEPADEHVDTIEAQDEAEKPVSTDELVVDAYANEGSSLERFGCSYCKCFKIDQFR